MKPKKSYSIREYGYLLNGLDAFESNNAIAIPSKAFKSLLKILHDDISDDVQNLFKLTTYNRKPALKVQNYAGVIQTPCGIQIEILPKLANLDSNKVSKDKTRIELLKMLRTLRHSPFKQSAKASIREAKMPLLEVYISTFLSLVNQLVKRGIRSDYVMMKKNAKFLKGRLMLGQQIRKNSFHQERFYIEYQEYQINRPANRLIKSTLSLVSHATQNYRNQRLAREMLFVFDEVPDSQDIRIDFQKIKTDRSMGYYNDVLAWCKLLLAGHAPTAIKGEFETLSLLYPMERIFEDYVAHCLRKSLDDYFPSGSQLKTQSSQYSLVEKHNGKPIFNLRPDLLIKNNNENICVLDTKWKLLDSSDRKNKYGISQADIYQLYAYGHKYLKNTSVKRLILIYPKTDTFSEPLNVFEYESGFTLEVVPFDIINQKLLLSNRG